MAVSSVSSSTSYSSSSKKSTTTTKSTASTSSSTSSKKVHAYEKTIYDVVNDSIAQQRSIGALVDETNTLTVKGTLGKRQTLSGVAVNNKVDFYHFTVKSSLDDVGIVVKAQGSHTKTLTSTSTTNDVGYATVEILDYKGNVVASSSTSATQSAQNNYQSMREQTLSLSKGSYTLRVSFAAGVPSSKTSNYAVQLMAGTTYKNSYTTTEIAPVGIDNVSELIRGATALSIIDASSTTATTNYSSTGTFFDLIG